MAMTETTRTWIHGLAATAIGGTSGSFATILVAPAQFNLETWDGFRHVCLVALITGAVNAASYLHQSPLPPAKPALGPNDTLNLKNATMSPSGEIQADSATLVKGDPDAKPVA